MSRAEDTRLRRIKASLERRARILDSIRRLSVFELNADRQDNLQDVARYIRHRLETSLVVGMAVDAQDPIDALGNLRGNLAEEDEQA